MKKRRCTSLLLMSVVLHVKAQQPVGDSANAQPLSTVEIKGTSRGVEETRDFVAGKIIIDKKTIQDSGAQNVSQVLRREPVITIGKDGGVSLLGLPGYTQILVDGTPSDGIDPLELDIVHVEKIEIIKSATAATGPFGIAGTINIVRRKIARKSITQWQAGAENTDGARGANISWMSNQASPDSPFSYNLAWSAERKNLGSRSAYFLSDIPVSAPPAVAYQGERVGLKRSDTLTGSGKFAWALDASHKVSFSPDLMYLALNSDATEWRRSSDAGFLALRGVSRSPFETVGLPLQWDWKLDEDSQLTVKLKTSAIKLSNDVDRREESSDRGTHWRSQRRDTRIRNQFLNLDFITSVKGGHDISAGTRVVHNHQQDDYADLIDGVPDFSEAVFGNAGRTRVTRYQLFAQDDWRINKTLAMGIGLSGERRLHAIDEGAVQNHSSFTVWSPSMHIAKKIGGSSKRQLRLSLARTFQPPYIGQMLLRPKISQLAPCYPQRPCFANTFDTADSTGNPWLQPERSRGVNLSYTHGMGAASEAGLEVYSREISNKIATQIELENVPWSNLPRYVTRPVNLAKARVRGIDLTSRIAARDLWKAAPALTLSGSLGFAHSEVSDIARPDNRLAGQLPWRAKIAVSYVAADMPLTINLDANYLPADWVRSSEHLRNYQSSRLTTNANAAWKFNAGPNLVLGVENLGARTRRHVDEYMVGQEMLRLSGRDSSYARLTIRLDFTL